MKRFWDKASASEARGLWQVRLDGKPVRTPGRLPLAVPQKALADAIVAEWNAVEGKIDPTSMPMTGLANAAIERIAPAREAFAHGLAHYAENEMCCYRAEEPDELVAKQARVWDALLDWASERYGISFETVSGVMHVAQPQATLTRLRQEVAREDSFHLAGLSPLVTAGQSLLVALAVRHEELSPEEGWAACRIEEDWQVEHWGEDAEAAKAAEARRADFLAGARFLTLL